MERVGRPGVSAGAGDLREKGTVMFEMWVGIGARVAFVVWVAVGVRLYVPKAVWERAGHVVRSLVLRGRWAVRAVRRAVALRVRLAGIGLRKRAGFLRAAAVLTRVCVPVWWARYIPASFREDVAEGWEALMHENVESVRAAVFARTGRIL